MKIDKDQHPDVYIIDASTPIENSYEANGRDAVDSDAIRIGHIRQLHKIINLRPYEAKTKVFILDNAHNLTAAASNALLKVLEEPPENSLIILISSKPALLFKTIISRCQVVKFSCLARHNLEVVLKKDYSLDSDSAHYLAYFCEGRIGEAIRLKETDLLREKNRIIDDLAFAKVGTAAMDLSIKNRDQLRQHLNLLALWFRDIYLIKVGMPHAELVNLDRKTDLLKSMQRFSFTELDGILKSISDSLLCLDQHINIKLLLLNLRAELWKG
jgi:DNA polymerase-3 subunit delta'